MENGHVLVVTGRCVPSESPEWWKRWESDHALVVSNNFLGSALEEEEDLEVTTSGDVTESASTIIVKNKDWRLSIGIPEENTHEFFWVLGLNKSKWMNSISL